MKTLRDQIQQFKSEREEVVEDIIEQRWESIEKLESDVGPGHARAIKAALKEAFNGGGIAEAALNRYK